MLRVVSAPELGDAAGPVFSVSGSLFLHPHPSIHTKLHEPALVTFLLPARALYFLSLRERNSGAQVKERRLNSPPLVGKAKPSCRRAGWERSLAALQKWQEAVAPLFWGLDKARECFLKMALWGLLLLAQLSLPGTGISVQSRNFEKSQKNREIYATGIPLEKGSRLTCIEHLLYTKPWSMLPLPTRIFRTYFTVTLYS